MSPAPSPARPRRGAGTGVLGGRGALVGEPGACRAPARSVLCVWTVTYWKRNVNVSQQINSAQKKCVATSVSQQSVVSARFAVCTPISHPVSVSSESPVYGETSGCWGCDRRVLSTCRDSFRNQGYPCPGTVGRLLVSLPRCFMGKVKEKAASQIILFHWLSERAACLFLEGFQTGWVFFFPSEMKYFFKNSLYLRDSSHLPAVGWVFPSTRGRERAGKLGEKYSQRCRELPCVQGLRWVQPAGSWAVTRDQRAGLQRSAGREQFALKQFALNRFFSERHR